MGSKVAETAGRALKKTVLELGGSDPFIVLEDADLDGAVEFAARARYQNTGQSCIAAKRFIVVEAVADQFEERFAAAAKALRVGDPLERDTKVGPLARDDLRDGWSGRSRARSQQGARVVAGWRAPGVGVATSTRRPSSTGVQPEMPAFREETFGPVAAVIRVRDAEEAVRWPTTPSSAWAVTSGRATLRGARRSRAGSKPAASSSTA